MKNIYNTVSGAVLAVAMLTVGGAASAQQSSEELGENIYSDAIVVTARKRDEKLQDVPLAVSVVTAEDISRKGVRDVAAVSDFTPGVQLDRANRYGTQGGSSRPVIRGMGNILGEPNAQIFIDGVPYSESILSFPFDLVERVEVIKGPQAALYGRSTFAGAINLITKRGSNDFRNSVSARLATHNDYEVNFLSRGPIVEDKIFYTAHARYYDFGGMYRNSLDNQRVGGEQSLNLNGSLEFRPSSDLSILLSGGYIRDRDDHPAIVTQDRFANNCYLDSPRQYYCGKVKEFDEVTLDLASLDGDIGLSRNSYRGSLIIDYKIGDFTITSNSGYFKTKTEFVHDSTYQGATALGRTTVPGAPGYLRPPNNGVRSGAVLRNEVGEREEIFTELRVQSPRISNAFDVMVGGAYYQRRRPLEERHFDDTAPTIDSGTDRINNIAVFGSINWDITDRLAASAEIRYAEDTIGNYKKATGVLAERKFTSTTPRFTIDYDISDNSMIYGTVAKGNKPGVFNSDPRFPVEVQFAEEETSWNYEIGSKNSFFNNRLTLNLAAYYVDWSNQQLSTSFTFPDSSTRSYIVNAGTTEVKGVEIELQGRFSDELTAGVSYSLNDATFVKFDDAEAGDLFGDPSVAGKLVPNVAKNQASAFVNYIRPVSTSLDFFARIDAAYNEEKFAQIYNLASTGDQYLVNLRAGIQGHNWKATFFIDNVTDDRTPSTVIRWVDQLNLNVPQYVNANPAQNNVPGSTTLERGFQVPLARKRQFGVTLSYDF
ncbi:TonB-dependent receptor [Parasphingorhabdus sp. JC815]|uniref:TonB-dependent receptor n=1 Tax=Parasphingorhabdus sp. JC815 TaxID=3232140 RepID=UPI00345AC23D